VSEPVTLRTHAGDEHLDLDELEARIRRGEIAPHCLVQHVAVTGERFVPAAELELFQRLHEPKRAYFARAFSVLKFPTLTVSFIALNLAIYLYTARRGPLGLDDMVRYGAKVAPLILEAGELWRLLSANLLHRDALHLGLNMFVLFNVGGVLENVYRRLDYLLLLWVSGLATMLSSLWLADAVSVGASGIVYGCFGGVVVFGLKYRAILPTRYRRVLGEAAIPAVLAFLLLGWTSRGVDNAGHMGGLAAGLCLAPFLRPTLLVEEYPSRLRFALRLLPAVLLVAAVAWGPRALDRVLPRVRVELDDDAGISVPIPTEWRRGADRLGQFVFFNGLPGFGRASFAARLVQAEVLASPEAQARTFVAEELKPSVLGPGVESVEVAEPTPSRIDGRPAVRLTATYVEPTGRVNLVAYFVERGEMGYQLVFRFPDDFPAYARVVDRMVEGIRLVEPRALREARAASLSLPNSPWPLGRLGEMLRRTGEPEIAAATIGEALKAQPASALLRIELARALLDADQVEAGCNAASDAVLYAPKVAAALEVSARCEVARGDVQKALARLKEAREQDPADERLERVERTLRAALR
jgi:membrane associated rhomboid family serine protease